MEKIYRGKRVVDSEALSERIMKDGRMVKTIADEAGVPFKEVMKMLNEGVGYARSIEQVRKVLRPKMRFSTLSPDELQPNFNRPNTENTTVSPTNHEPKDPMYYRTAEGRAKIVEAFGEQIAKDIELADKLMDLCNEYSFMAVVSTIDEFQSEIFSYLEDCKFDLMELHKEALNRYPGVDANEAIGGQAI